MGDYIVLAIFFLIPFAGVLWVWRGVRIWQVGAIALIFGIGYGLNVFLAKSVADWALGSFLGPGPDGWLARRLAGAGGLSTAGLTALALTFFNRRQSSK